MKTSFNPPSLISKVDERCDRSIICWPFMPYIGEKYETAPVKVMVIGKATYGWGRKNGDNLTTLPRDNIAGALEALTRDFIDKVESFYCGERGYNSSFWRRTYMLVSALLERDDKLRYERNSDKSKKCFNSLSWNNVFKFGSVEGNPPEELIDILINEDKSLHEDIISLNPDLVLFSTGVTYDEYLKKILPGSELEMIGEEPNDLMIIKIPYYKGLAIRTTHFQRLSNQRFEELYEHIKDYLF